MSRIITPGPVKPPGIMLEYLAQQRLIERYESLLESWSRVLSCLAKHGNQVRKGRGIRQVPGGFAFPHNWQEDLPNVCDLNVVEDDKAGEVIVRLLEPTPRINKADDDGWIKPNESAVLKDDADRA